MRLESKSFRIDKRDKAFQSKSKLDELGALVLRTSWYKERVCLAPKWRALDTHFQIWKGLKRIDQALIAPRAFELVTSWAEYNKERLCLAPTGRAWDTHVKIKTCNLHKNKGRKASNKDIKISALVKDIFYLPTRWISPAG